MRAGAEGEARIEPHDHRVLRVHVRVVGRDPQAPPETHGMEVAQPFAFPDAVGQRLEREAFGLDAQHVREAGDQVIRRGIERKQRLQPRMRPQAKFAGSRFENRIVALVGVRDGDGAELEAGLLDALGVEPVQSQREGKLRHA